MELRVIDFEVLTRNFQPYVDGYREIESEKRKMLESIDPDKKQMDDIIKRSQSGTAIDEDSQKRDMEDFRKIQDKLMRLDQDFKKRLKEMSDDLNTGVYDQLSEIIEEWATANSINLVMGKMEVIFNTKDIDATDEILEVVKEKGLLYTDVVSAEVIEPNA
jgi:Skp family chaperone for outer membrane proteins